MKSVLRTSLVLGIAVLVWTVAEGETHVGDWDVTGEITASGNFATFGDSSYVVPFTGWSGSSRMVAVRQPTAVSTGVSAGFMFSNNQTSGAFKNIAQLMFLNEASVVADKRVAQILVQTGGNINSGKMFFRVYDTGVATDAVVINRFGGTTVKFADLYTQTTAFMGATSGSSGNTASGTNSTVGGGRNNTASGNTSTVGGGSSNDATGDAAAVPGGYSNTASGDRSFAAGYNATASHDNSFVWGDDGGGTSAAANTFNVHASGGIYYEGGAIHGPSDRNVKENFEPVDSRAVLAKVAALPMSTWNYKTEDGKYLHMGPMGQDFHAAFGLGTDEKHITTVDADGVALAAIQGLYEAGLEKDAEIRMLKARLAALEEAMSKE